MKVTVIPIVIGALGTILKCLVKELEENGNRIWNQDHQNYNIIEISHKYWEEF